MLVAALVGTALDLDSVSSKTLWQRLRLSAPRGTAWLWASNLSGFMFGGNWADCVAIAASWLALLKEKTSRRWAFVGIWRPCLSSVTLGSCRRLSSAATQARLVWTHSVSSAAGCSDVVLMNESRGLVLRGTELYVLLPRCNSPQIWVRFGSGKPGQRTP